MLVPLLAGCRGTQPEPPESKPELLNTSASVRYVGEEACGPCHLQQSSTYSHTGMGRAFYPLTPANAVEDFTSNNEFVDEKTGLHYRMEQRDGRYYQRQFLVDSQGHEMASDEYEMTLVVGSNNHSRSYIVFRDDKLFQAPVCWYPAVTRWDFCPGYEIKNDHFNREISLNCLQCHNGRMEPFEGVRNQFREPYPHGIGCERCHGPGELHVQRWKGSSATPSGEPDPTIVHPRRLSRAERLDVCFQCHLADSKATSRVGRPGRDLQEFRPGQPLTDFVVAFHYSEQTEYEFGLSAQGDRMILSRCYTESGGKLECLTCHDPHVTVYHEERPADYFTQRCIGCHTAEACSAPEHERLNTAVPDDCVACHMRKAETDDQRFAVFTDHWIRRRIDLGEPDHRENHEIEPVDTEYFATLSRGERAFYYGRAHSLLALNLKDDVQQEMWRHAEASFLDAIDEGYDTVDAWFFLGKARQHLGRQPEAAEAFQRAYEIDPAHHDAAFAFGQSLFSRGDLPGAVRIFEQMLSQDPNDPMALAELGRALTALNRLDQALGVYEKALEREPWNASLHLNRGMLLAATGRFGEAEEEARAAVRLNADGIPEWEFYEKLMLALERPELASEARRLLQRLQPTSMARAGSP
jgi:Flp pilus assembly protein TadD